MSEARQGAGALFFLAGLVLIAFHAYEWARYGAWASYTLLSLLSQIGLASEWVQYPLDWLGVHDFLSWAPVWGACLVVGFVLVAIDAA